MVIKPGYPAVFSAERGYRYVLWRKTLRPKSDLDYLNFICLNPSTADERVNDPTMRRIVGYASSFGFRYVAVTNLFAFRTSDSTQLRRAADPIGSENDRWLLEVAQYAGRVVCAWGNEGSYMARNVKVVSMLKSRNINLYMLGETVTAGREPRHPLYAPKNLQLTYWRGYK